MCEKSTPSLPPQISTPQPQLPRVTTKRRKLVDSRPSAAVPADLGELILRDVQLVKELGWEAFVTERRGRGDLTEMEGVHHPARRLLRGYSLRGVPVKMHGNEWDKNKLDEAMKRGPH